MSSPILRWLTVQGLIPNMSGKPPIRIPLAAPYENREAVALGTYLTDTYNVNCYIETQPDGRKLVVKRPGLSTAFTYNGGGATNGQGTVFYKNTLMAMGSNVLYLLNGSGNASADGTAWTASTAAPWAGRTRFGCTIFNGQTIIAGGQNTGGIADLNDVWASTDNVNWTQLVSAAPWSKRHDCQLAVLGNTLYLIGGCFSIVGELNDVWSTPDGVNWTQVVGTAPWATRQGHGVVVFNQGIWVLGGFSSALGAYLNDVWFSPDGATWTQQVTVAGWGIRAFHSCIVQNKNIVVAGGTNGAGLADIWISTNGITWANPVNLPAARQQMATFAYNGLVWWLGGLDAATNKTTTVWSWPVTAAAVTVVSAAYGGNALGGAQGVVYRTPTSVNAMNAATMWLIGGNDSVSFTNNIYRATLNVALAVSFSPATGGATTDQFDFETQNAGDYLVFKNTTDAWVFYGGLVSKITSTNYPVKNVVRGLVNLDDTIYVMDSNGVIYGSDLSTPFNWSANNFITADFLADTGVMIVKYKNLVLALKSNSMQFFQDAGRFPGSPLLPVIQYNAKVGCISAAFVVQMMDTVVWIARNEKGTPYVAVLDGITAKKISTPAVDRLLTQWPGANVFDTAFGTRINGHYCYVFIFGATAISMAYDFTEEQWWIINTGSSNFSSSHSVSDGVNYYLQDIQLGAIYQILSGLYQDSGVAMTSIIQTIKVDGGTNTRKFTAGLTVIGDRRDHSGANNLTVQWSDDDAQTFNTGVTVDLTLARPRISRTGSFRRRTYKLTHASNNPFRLEALEQEITG